jgi:hypothetical protein
VAIAGRLSAAAARGEEAQNAWSFRMGSYLFRLMKETCMKEVHAKR